MQNKSKISPGIRFNRKIKRNNMKLKLTAFLLPIILITGFKFNRPDNSFIYQNTKYKIDERVNDLLKRMTLEEKLEMIGGTGFATAPIKRLGIPELKMTDGPVGVRWDISTAYPSGVSMAATWNPELIYKVGQSIARDTKAKGRDVILGPCVNIVRLPIGGRNFESFGEDPFLTSRLAVDYIKGVQSENVAATVKHFACNNHEYERDFVNVEVDERSLNELYLPSFKAAVTEADVFCVMSSYNKVNGHYASENTWLLQNKLKNEWMFKGLVMSDWGAVHSTIPTYNNGLDLEMPEGKYLNKKELSSLLEKKVISEDIVNDKVSRILTVMFRLGMFDNKEIAIVDSKKLNKEIALQTAKESIVLLKNENILPISSVVKTIAVIGGAAINPRISGGGSSMVNTENILSPYTALENELGSKVQLKFAQGSMLKGDSNPIPSELFSFNGKTGIQAEYFDNKTLSGYPVKVITEKEINNEWRDKAPYEWLTKDNFSVRWITNLKAAKSDSYKLDFIADDGIKVYIDDKLVINDWTDHATQNFTTTVDFKENESHKIVLEYYENGGEATAKLGWRRAGVDLTKQALDIAKDADLVLVFAGTSYLYESEGFDRDNIDLPENQNELIDAITKQNKNVVVILSSGQPVTMPWKNNVKGIVQTWFGGEEIASALTSILTGKYNPSGKLPVTFPVKLEDCLGYSTYKKVDSSIVYSDGIFVGYRLYDKKKIEPLFPFGHGLSYTDFSYGNLQLSSKTISPDGKIIVSIDVTNKGAMEGAETVQMYLSDVQCSVERPEQELKGFHKISLKPGETKKVEFTIDKSMLSFYDFKNYGWTCEQGEFKVLIGSSSRDIKQKGQFILK